MASTEADDVSKLISMFSGFQQTLVVKGACDLELFDRLSKHRRAMTANVFATAQGWNSDATMRLMDALVSLDLLIKSHVNGEFKYSVSKMGELLRREARLTLWGYPASELEFLDSLKGLPQEVRTGEISSSKPCAHHFMDTMGEDHGHGHNQEHCFHHDAQHGHSGHHGDSVGHHGGDIEMCSHSEDNSPSADTHRHRHEFAHGDAQFLVDTYKTFHCCQAPYAHAFVTSVDLSSYKKAVDLGGGSGVIAYELARSYPQMEVVMFEVPPVAKMAEQYFLPRDEHLNVTVVGGDFEESFPAADLYILAHVVHDWTLDQIQTLFKKIFDSLSPGGGLMLIEGLVNEDRNGPVFAHIWDVALMTSCTGRLRSSREYRNITEDAGFREFKVVRTPQECASNVVFAKKPSA